MLLLKFIFIENELFIFLNRKKAGIAGSFIHNLFTTVAAFNVLKTVRDK